MSDTFHQLLESSSGRKLKLRINDNHSTMLSVRWEPDQTRISLHRMFLRAPGNVMEALACYIRRGKNETLPASIKAFIEHQVQELDYSHKLKNQNLVTEGEHFHLLPIFETLNCEYFDNQLDLQITWYGEPNRLFRSRINFGLYSDPLKLIKVHRSLDQVDIPQYFVEFVVYHEMLHNVCAPYVDHKGQTIVHTLEFKERETEFKDFHKASQWLKDNKDRFFE